MTCRTPQSQRRRWLHVDLPGGRFRIRIRATGQGRPVFLIHGLAESSRYFYRLNRRLADRHRLFAFDLPGFGQSSKPPIDYSLALFRQAIDAVWFAAGRPDIVIGHSLGGILAADLAARYPNAFDAMALISTPFPDGTYNRDNRPDWFQLHRTTSAKVMFMHTLWMSIRPVLLPLGMLAGYPPEVVWDYMRHVPRSYVSTIEHVIDEFDIRPMLARIAQTPLAARTLLLQGSKDGIVQPSVVERWHESLPGSQLVFVSAGHHPPLGTGIPVIANWLASIDSTGPGLDNRRVVSEPR